MALLILITSMSGIAYPILYCFVSNEFRVILKKKKNFEYLKFQIFIWIYLICSLFPSSLKENYPQSIVDVFAFPFRLLSNQIVIEFQM